MGLQVWLPLIKDVRNYGLSNLTFINNGATVNDSGKIGGCYSFNGSSYLESSTSIGNGVTNWTISCWINPDATTLTSGQWYRIGGIGSHNRVHLDVTSDNKVRCFVSFDGTTGTNIQGAISNIVLETGTWYHVCGTVDDTSIKIYVNGILERTVAINKTYSSTSSGIVRVASVNNGNNFYGKINDFRIYDHCLSPREIKEISKGLVLHYPLSMPGQENLLLNTATPVSWTTTYTNTDQWSTKDIYNMKSPVNQLFVANDTATFSFDWQFTPGSSGSIKGSFHLETGNVTPWILGSVSKSTGTRNNASNYIDLSTTNKSGHVTCTFIVSSSAATAADTFRYFRIRWDKTPTDGTLTLSNCKLERGEIATPWIPNIADTAYSTLGFNDGIEYDVSGYNHNGKRVGNITYDADTPRYETSAVFDYAHVINDVSTVHLSNEFTISWWGKINTWRKVWEGMFLLQNTTALNSASGTYSIGSAIHASTASAMTLTLRQGGTTYPFDHYNWTYTVGTWAHYACTYKNGVIIMYQNGAQVYTATIDNSSSGDYYYTIGKRVNNCICQLSDFRIYNTALSADDILELYHTPETLANNGALLTQGEYEEV